MKNDSENFSQLVDLMKKLRSKKGCPWDRAQTHRSLLPYLIEEAYEVLDSAEKKDDSKLKEELGDLLLQIIFHAEIAREEKRFDIYQVIDNLILKLIQRHPHVFKNRKMLSSQQVLRNWEHIKLATSDNKSVLSGLPRTLPALLKAFRVGEKVSRYGFDWQRKEDIFPKLKEELKEFKKAYSSKSKKRIEEELGDIFFTLVNLCRHLKINPELALGKTVEKFIWRFNYIEKELSRNKKSLKKTSLRELDYLWEKSKKNRGVSPKADAPTRIDP
jgi:tetrapyrrole methylase family protein/MazG family protein